MSEQDLIWESLEAAAEKCEDLAPEVYSRFFSLYPQALEIFGLNPFLSTILAEMGQVDPQAPSKFGSGAAKLPPEMGNMINEMLRLVADGPEGEIALANEMVSIATTHAGMGIDLAMYRALFKSISDTVQATAGRRWTVDMEAAWLARSNRVLLSMERSLQILDV